MQNTTYRARRRRLPLHLLFWIGLVTSPTAVGADVEGVYLLRPAEYDRYGGFDPAMRKKCRVETALPAAVAQRRSTVHLMERGAPRDDELVLELKILRLDAAFISVRGKLTRRDEVVGSFRGSRSSIEDLGAQYGGAFRGRCGRIQRPLARLAQDIAEFLRQPSLGAHLGTGG